MATAVVRAALLAAVVVGIYLVARRYLALLLAVGILVFGVLLPTGFLAAAASASSSVERLDGWLAVSPSVIANPLGAGVGTTGAAAELAVEWGAEPAETFGLPPPELTETFGLLPEQLPYQPDNYYVKRLLELGPIGLWLTVSVLRQAVGSARAVRDRASPRDAALADGIIASILGASAAALMATYWEIFPVDFYFWLLLGVVSSIEYRQPTKPGGIVDDVTRAQQRP